MCLNGISLSTISFIAFLISGIWFALISLLPVISVYKDLSNECSIFTTALLPKTSLTALIYIYSNPFVYIFWPILSTVVI